MILSYIYDEQPVGTRASTYDVHVPYRVRFSNSKGEQSLSAASISPPSWGLLSRFRLRVTTTPTTEEVVALRATIIEYDLLIHSNYTAQKIIFFIFYFLFLFF